jgi:glutamate synthase (NADPH/NADH) small chain
VTPEERRKLMQELLAKRNSGGLKAKDRLAIPPQEIPEQDATARRRNVSEVALGYTEEQARLEALRCLQCKNAPCVEGCPVRIRIRDFVGAIAEGDYRKALEIIKENSLLPAVCGRVCPQEVQCQEKCTVGLSLKDVSKAVSIGRLERFVADWRDEGVPPSRVVGILPAIRGQDALDTKEQGRDALATVPAVAAPTGMKVAIIGSGPGGIVAAADTRRTGHEVTVFEAFQTGRRHGLRHPGVRRPSHRPAESRRSNMGVKIVNFIVGGRTIEQLMKEDGFDAVYIGVGRAAQLMNRRRASWGSTAPTNLTRANLMKAYQFGAGADTPIARSKRVAVVGGGNVAMDSARTAVRLGAEKVYLIYRRTEKEMPARVEEVHHAKQEGVEFHLLQNPKRILGDANGNVIAIECLRYELGEPDASGRRRPVAIPGSEFQIEVDTVIVAIGNLANPLIRQTTPGLEFNQWGNIVVDENCRTSMEGVFAGGDIVLGAATVILAMGQGRIAAAAMNEYLAQKRKSRKG